MELTKKDRAFMADVAHNLRDVHFFSVGACIGCDACGLAPQDCTACDGTGKAYDDDGNETAAACATCTGSGTVQPTERDRESADNGDEFSWQACESCGCTLGGARYPAHGILADSLDAAQVAPDALRLHFAICADCIQYHANGELPQE